MLKIAEAVLSDIDTYFPVFPLWEIQVPIYQERFDSGVGAQQNALLVFKERRMNAL
jgi:hypothetical protein